MWRFQYEISLHSGPERWRLSWAGLNQERRGRCPPSQKLPARLGATSVSTGKTWTVLCGCCSDTTAISHSRILPSTLRHFYEIFTMLNALGGPTNHCDTPMGPPGACGTRAEDPGVHYHFQGVIKQQIIKHKLLVCISLGFLFIYILWFPFPRS